MSPSPKSFPPSPCFFEQLADFFAVEVVVGDRQVQVERGDETVWASALDRRDVPAHQVDDVSPADRHDVVVVIMAYPFSVPPRRSAGQKTISAPLVFARARPRRNSHQNTSAWKSARNPCRTFLTPSPLRLQPFSDQNTNTCGSSRPGFLGDPTARPFVLPAVGGLLADRADHVQYRVSWPVGRSPWSSVRDLLRGIAGEFLGQAGVSTCCWPAISKCSIASFSLASWSPPQPIAIAATSPVRPGWSGSRPGPPASQLGQTARTR